MKVVSVNISVDKGTIKRPVDKITLDERGVINDINTGNRNQQISLLGEESIQKFSKEINRGLQYGESAENITTRGITLNDLQPLDHLVIGDTEIEITRTGKKSPGTNYQIFKTTGDPVMPGEGVFARVITGGDITAGMKIEFMPKVLKVLVITLSDRASQGIYEDMSGPMLQQEIENFLEEKKRKFMASLQVIPDNANALQKILKEGETSDLIFTTGSTGIGPRDIAPDVIKPWIEKEIPGIMDHIRLKYGAEKPGALLSRGIAGIKGKTQIYALPGSPKAIKEYTTEIFKTLQHCLYMLHQLDIH